MLKVENLSKRYKKQVILDRINFSINSGNVVAVVGESGAGKSTLLQCLAQIVSPDNGKIIVNNQTLNFSRNRKKPKLISSIGMVFQQYHLWPHLTVLKNITLAATTVLKFSLKNADEKALFLLERLNLRNKCDHYPSQLSGGEQQRIALARALMMDPSILLFDEPTAALDPATKQQVGVLIKELANSGKALILSTHDMAFAEQVSTHILFLKSGKVELFKEKSAVFCNGDNTLFQHLLIEEKEAA